MYQMLFLSCWSAAIISQQTQTLAESDPLQTPDAAQLKLLNESLLQSSSSNGNEAPNVIIGNTVDDKTIGQKQIWGYYTQWSTYGRNYQVSDIPAQYLTHILYAFAKPELDGSLVLGDEYADVQKIFPGDSQDSTQQPFQGNLWQLNVVLKERNPHIKTLISIGGWTWSGHFSTIAASEATRKKFASDCVELVQKYRFDGVDLDWEYPVAGGLENNTRSPNDTKNYVLLVKEIREQFKQLSNGSDYLLTIAGPANPEYVKNIDLREMNLYIDYVNVMTYDYRGGWSSMTGHQCNMFDSTTDPDQKEKISSKQAIDAYNSGGMPVDKLNLGAALYGRGWSGVESQDDGLFQKFSAVPKGTWDDEQSGDTGVFDYKDLHQKSQQGSLKRFWDDQAKAAWLYDSSSKFMVSYDDPESISIKVNYITQAGLSGIMFWELSGDTFDDSSLVKLANQNLKKPGLNNFSSKPQDPNTFPAGSNLSNSTQAQNLNLTQNLDASNQNLSETLIGNILPVINSTLGNSTSLPQQNFCMTQVSSCDFSQNTFACIGSILAICNDQNSWDLRPCQQDMKCGMKNGNVGCFTQAQLGPGSQICAQ